MGSLSKVAFKTALAAQPGKTYASGMWDSPKKSRPWPGGPSIDSTAGISGWLPEASRRPTNLIALSIGRLLSPVALRYVFFAIRSVIIAHGRGDLVADLDPMAERQLCTIAEKECGAAALFVTAFPLRSRPFYTHPAPDGVHAAGFDLLLRGLEVTTGGQRLHRRADLEAALRAQGIDPKGFETHLRMFDLGMPPHGGLAIGLERLTCQVLGLTNVREATFYPRDINRLEPLVEGGEQPVARQLLGSVSER